MTACSNTQAQRRQDRAIDAQLRERAPRSARKKLGHVHVGDYAIMHLGRRGGGTSLTVGGAGKAVSQSRTMLDLEHSPTHVTWSTDCTSRFERTGLKELDGLTDSQSTQQKLSCKVTEPDGDVWSFEAERTRSDRLEGRFHGASGAFDATVIVQASLTGASVPTVHLRQDGEARAASVMTSPERMWLDPGLSEDEAGATAAFMLALRYVDYTSQEDKRARSSDEKQPGVLDVVGGALKK